jgi:hypothetical protein
MLSNQQIQSNWTKIKSQVLLHWNKLTEPEVETTHGWNNSLSELVFKKYGANGNFDQIFEVICDKVAPIKLGSQRFVTDVAEKSMDKDRDDNYLTAQKCVTRPIVFKTHKKKIMSNKNYGSENFNESFLDGFNNEDRHSADYSGLNNKIEFNKLKTASDGLPKYQVPGFNKDITLGRSNSSANTTSHSALPTSEAMSKDTMML